MREFKVADDDQFTLWCKNIVVGMYRLLVHKHTHSHDKGQDPCIVLTYACTYIFNITASTHGRESTHSRTVVGSYSPTYTHYVSVNLMSKVLRTSTNIGSQN